MRQKWLIVSLLGLALVGVCAGILAATWGGVRWARDTGFTFDNFADNDTTAEATEQQQFTVDGPAQLDLENLSGNVEIVAGPGQEIVVSAHKTAWGADDAEAQAALAVLQVTMVQTGNVLTIRVTLPPKPAYEWNGYQVDFTIQVPADTAVEASTGFGRVSAEGVTQGVALTSSSGGVSASGVAGDVELHSDFGDVTLESAEPGTVTAFSSSGRVTLRQVQAAGQANLTSGFGAISFQDGAAAGVDAQSSSGPVTLTDLALSGALTAHSDFGDVSVTRVAAAGYDLSTSSGAIVLDGASGSVSADTGFGTISVIHAVAVTLDLHSSSGEVAFSGSLGDGPHMLSTDFGDVRLSLPGDTALDLDLRTGFGSIHSAFPVTLSGDLDESHWQGTLNGGGPGLTVDTDSGSITLDILIA